MTRISSFSLVLIAFVVTGWPRAAFSGEEAGGWRLRRTATGAWGGERDRLEESGILPNGFYLTDILGNPVGGLDQDVAYAGRVELDLSLDLEKLLSARGLGFDVSISWAGGSNLSQSIGNVFQVAEVYIDTDVWLARLYLEQDLGSGRGSLKLGRVSAGNDFAVLPVFAFSVNLGANGNPLAISLNDPGFFADPVAQWGLRGIVTISSTAELRVGAYLSDPAVGDPSNRGLDFSFTPGDGVLAIGELGLTPRPRVGGRKLPGHYRFGAYHDSAEFPSLADPDLSYRGQYGWYVVAEQQVTREAGSDIEEVTHPLFGRHIVRNRHLPGTIEASQGLTVWFAAVCSPKQEISPMPLQLSGGLIYRGLFHGRPRDIAGLWLIHGRFSGDLPDRGTETVVQLTYAYRAAPWLYVTPNAQVVIDPGGHAEIPTALVLGFEVGVTF